MFRRARFSFLIIGILTVIAISFVSGQVYSYFQPVTAEGRYVLLRLEDVGPGGFYGTPEGIGKLRAVLDYLKEQNVAFHISVVPRWKTYSEKTGWQEAGIDTPTPLTELFVQVLREAQAGGAILGMHGYSHQFGDVPRADGQHNSGFANEFNIKGEAASESTAYAAERIEKSLRAFEQNGLKPAYWETPHYNATFAQQKVFRSYMGVLYEPNKRQLRSLRDVVYVEDENEWLQPSQGSVYIPAPLRYIFNSERVQYVLNQLRDYDGLASLYYHPFLEFEYLEPVTVNGQPELRNGLPEYRYKPGTLSPLHKLINGIKATHYEFGTIHDVVPFSPAHRLTVSPGITKQNLLTGDVNGDGKDDWAVIDTKKGQVTVTLSNLDWPRNKKTNQPSIWLQHRSLTENSQVLLVNSGRNDRKDLLQIKSDGILMFMNEGTRFRQEPVSIDVPPDTRLTLNRLVHSAEWLCHYQKSSRQTFLLAVDKERRKGQTFVLSDHSLVLQNVFEIPSNVCPNSETHVFFADTDGDTYADVIFQNPSNKLVWVMRGKENGFSEPEIWYSSSHGDLVRIGDYNGDGKEDLLFYDQNGIWQVAHSTGSSFQKMPASFGPWARRFHGIPVSGDWDGNGKADIGMYDADRGIIDTALSYQD